MNDETIRDLQIRARAANLNRDHANALALRQEVERLQMAEGTVATDVAKNLNWIAFFAVCVGDLAEAERAARRCVEVFATVPNGASETMATYLSMLSGVLAESGKFGEAVLFGDRAVSIFAANHGDDSQFVKYGRLDVDRMRREEPGPYVDR